MRQKKRYDKSVYRSLTMMLQFGINMLVPICMMTAAGIFLDDKFGTSFWMVVLFFVGAIAGGQNVYRMAKQVYAAPSKPGVQKEQSSRNANSGNVKKDK